MFQWSPFQLSGHRPHDRANRPVIWSYAPGRYSTLHEHTLSQMNPHYSSFLKSSSTPNPPSVQFTMLQSSCSISTFEDCPSPSNWTRGTKLQNTRWECFRQFALPAVKRRAEWSFLHVSGEIEAVWGQALNEWISVSLSWLINHVKNPKQIKNMIVLLLVWFLFFFNVSDRCHLLYCWDVKDSFRCYISSKNLTAARSRGTWVISVYPRGCSDISVIITAPIIS